MSADRTSSNEFEAEGEPLGPRKVRTKSERDASGDTEGDRWRCGIQDGSLWKFPDLA